jgi:peptidoglycan/xylan/chitin deacetylase (PgdA/CDA1 family)
LAVLLTLLPVLAACGGDGKQGGQIQWVEGQPGAGQASTNTEPTVAAPTQAPAATDVPQTVAPTQAAPEPTATSQPAAPTSPSGEAVKLSAAQLEQYKPNEIGLIPILEYHQLVTDPSQEASFVRPIEKFKKDLQWLYDNNFHIVSVRDIITNHIDVPAGKHPVALTFDDSTAGQFRYLIAADGSVTIDPDSGVGILEAFFADHPDFGRGGYFAVITSDSTCFNWQGTASEDDQTKYCHQKIKWLLDNGYEVGNHTENHENMQDMTDEKFLEEVGQPFEWLNAIDPRNSADILTVPFGVYPDKDKHHQQRVWMTDGFTYNGNDYKFIGVLNVGAEPTFAVDSTEWDPLWISRIQMDDGTDYGYSGYWFPAMEGDPSWLYTSDGNPNTITVPNEIPSQDGDVDPDKVAAEGKELIRY